MGPFDSCRLIHINLSSYIIDPFTDKAHIDEELLYMHSYEAMRLADDLVDLEIEAVDRIINTVKNDTDDTEFKLWSRIKETAIQGRRTIDYLLHIPHFQTQLVYCKQGIYLFQQPYQYYYQADL